MDIKTICNQSNIIMSSPIIKKDLINYNISYELYKQGYDIYNINSNFYYDDCTPAHIGNLDIGFYKRREDFYPNNISFCLENCSYEYTDYNLSRFICNWNISTNIKNSNIIITEDNFFKYIDDNINYRIFKCFNLFIGYKFMTINIGFYLGIIILFIFSFNIFYFSTKAIQLLRLKLIQNIKYIKNNFYFKNKNVIKKTKSLYNKSNKSNPSKKPKVRKRKNKIKISKVNYDIYSGLKKAINNNSNSNVGPNKITINNIRKKSRKKNVKKRKFNSSEIMINVSYSNSYVNSKSINSLENNLKIDKKLLKNPFLKENGKNIDDDDYNDLTYFQALKKDKRNIITILFNTFIIKINLIQLCFYPEEFTSKSITVNIFILSCFLELFINSILYTDEIISRKYHNNGELEFFTSIFLSIVSNIVCSFLSFIIKKFTQYHLLFTLMKKEIKIEKYYLIAIKNTFQYIKQNIIIFIIISYILILISLYYITIFCIMYYNSQIGLLYNYSLGIIESLFVSIISSMISSILRLIGLKCKIKQIFETSKFINDKI